jgi:excisionase family DNA binding protein
MEKQTMNVREFMAVSGLSRSFTYKLIKEGMIPVIRLGRKVLIPAAAALQLLNAEMQRKS